VGDDRNSSTISVRPYPVLLRAVEEGVAMGWQRAYKHTDQPGAAVVQEAIVQSVLAEISEYFEFERTP
jgi:hypothetical protein